MFLFGWPSCTTPGCPWPGVFKVEVQNEGGSLWTHLCLGCFASVPKTLKSLSEFGESEGKLLKEVAPGDLPKTEIIGVRDPESR